MKIREMKKELETYGISTATILEKSELVAALEKARVERRINRRSSNPKQPPPPPPAKRTKTTTAPYSGSNEQLKDGEDRLVQGSGKNPYSVSRRGDVYSCTCAAWKFQKGINIALRTCKHIRGIQGAQFEFQRTNNKKTAAAAAAAASTKKGTNDGENGSLLPFSSVMLAKKYEEENHGNKLSTGVWWMSEKLDGLRAIWDGNTFMSRAGNKFHAPIEFVKDFPKDIVLDGELFCGRNQFDIASGLVRSFGGTYEQWNGKVSYEVFDAPLVSGKFEDRMKTLKTVTSKMKHANIVVQERVQDASHVSTKLASIESIGGEGLMLRKGGSSYEQKRSNSLLKVKSMMDAEAKVIGYQTGKGRNSDRLGALVCQLVDNTGKTFKVGSGLTDAERENPPSIGAIITFSFFEYTKSGVPRFPRYKRVFPGN